jgi:hypothetical protein
MNPPRLFPLVSSTFPQKLTNDLSPWPGLTRLFTPSGARNEDVDARIKSAQSDFNVFMTGVNIHGLQTYFARTALRFRGNDDRGLILIEALRIGHSRSRVFCQFPYFPTTTQ